MSEIEHEALDEPEAPAEPTEPEAPANPVEPTPEEEETAEGEHEPEPEQPQALGEKEIERRQKALDRATDAYVKKVQGIMEDEFEHLIPSPLTLPNVLGFIYSPAEVEIPQEQIAATHFLLGITAPAELKDAPDASRCTTCDGHGKVLTGSQVPEFREGICSACNGAGAVGERYRDLTPAPPRPVPVTENGGEAPAQTGSRPIFDLQPDPNGPYEVGGKRYSAVATG